MKRQFLYVIGHIICMIIAAISLQLFVAPNGGSLHKSLAGFLIGTYAVFGKEIAKLGVASLSARAMPKIDKSPAANAFVLFAFVGLAFSGLIAWATSWVGSTGIHFGIAVFISAVLSDYGFAPVLREFHPVPVKSEA